MADNVTTKSIILKRVAYGDADWIVAFFSRDHGRMSGIAKSGRKSLRRFGSGLEPGAVTNLTYVAHGRSDLVRLDESQVVFSTTGMMSSLARIEAAGRAIMLALSFLKDHHAAPEKFDLMEQYLATLSQREPTGSMRLGFDLNWLKLAGFEPSLDLCVACGDRAHGDGVFSIEHGGALCSDCGDRGGPVFQLSTGMRASMSALLRNPFETTVSTLNGPAIAALLDRYVAYILERPIG